MIGQRHSACVESLKKGTNVLSQGRGLDQDCFQGRNIIQVQGRRPGTGRESQATVSQ